LRQPDLIGQHDQLRHLGHDGRLLRRCRHNHRHRWFLVLDYQH
jgi:hypothetical protein